MIPRSCSVVEGPVPPTSLLRSMPEKRLVSAHLRARGGLARPVGPTFG